MIRDIQKVNDDIVEMKRLIKQKLIDDPDILEALNNKEIPLDSSDEFLDNNIYGFIRVPKAQDTVRNFICFTAKKNFGGVSEETANYFIVVCEVVIPVLALVAFKSPI